MDLDDVDKEIYAEHGENLFSRSSNEFFYELLRIFGFWDESLISFIDKDRQIEMLAERLCTQRLKGATDPAHAADIAYCLSLLNYAEKSFKKLAANISCYADQLVHEPVYASFQTIVQKVRDQCTLT